MSDTQPDGPTEFWWERPLEGFHWVDREGSRGRTVRYLVPAGVQTEPIQPLESPELLRQFTELEATEEAILAFANCHGLLEHAVGRNGEERFLRGEELEDWRREIDLVRTVVRIWDCVAAGDRKGIKKWFSLDGHFATYVGPGSPIYFSGPLADAPFYIGPDTPSDLLDVSADLVARLIHFHYGDNVTWWHVHSPGERRLETISQPDHLRAVIWSQLSQLTRGGADQRRCPECGTWFTVSIGRKRSDSLFDRDACKSKAYRTRKANAIRMRQQGMKLRDIAKKLDTKLAVVRVWIDPTKRKPKPVTTVDRLRTRHKRKLKARGGA